MADTGAPWNIPYVEPSDLVRNYPVANELMADAIAAGLTAAGNPGIGSNVVQTVKTDTFTTSSSSLVDITDYDVTITPTLSTSKVLVMVDLAIAPAGSAGSAFPVGALLRGATVIYGGASPGNRTPALFKLVNAGASGATDFFANGVVYRFSAVFLDSPGVATATTYKVQVKTSSGSVHINRGGTDTDTAAFVRAASSITAIEVAA